ncbi:hypothetical protein V2J09_024210 [Rumex salicifolius]
MKLFLVLAAASVLIVAAHAAYLEEETGNPLRSRCMKQMRMMEPQLDQCEDYVTTMDDSMTMDEERKIRGCCRAMKEMDEDCMCQWMKKTVQHQQRGEMGQEDMRMMMRKMKMMPNECGMGPMSCPMGTGRRGYDQ